MKVFHSEGKLKRVCVKLGIPKRMEPIDVKDQQKRYFLKFEPAPWTATKHWDPLTPTGRDIPSSEDPAAKLPSLLGWPGPFWVTQAGAPADLPERQLQGVQGSWGSPLGSGELLQVPELQEFGNAAAPHFDPA